MSLDFGVVSSDCKDDLSRNYKDDLEVNRPPGLHHAIPFVVGSTTSSEGSFRIQRGRDKTIKLVGLKWAIFSGPCFIVPSLVAFFSANT